MDPGVGEWITGPGESPELSPYVNKGLRQALLPTPILEWKSCLLALPEMAASTTATDSTRVEERTRLHAVGACGGWICEDSTWVPAPIILNRETLRLTRQPVCCLIYIQDRPIVPRDAAGAIYGVIKATYWTYGSIGCRFSSVSTGAPASISPWSPYVAQTVDSSGEPVALVQVLEISSSPCSSASSNSCSISGASPSSSYSSSSNCSSSSINAPTPSYASSANWWSRCVIVTPAPIASTWSCCWTTHRRRDETGLDGLWW